MRPRHTGSRLFLADPADTLVTRRQDLTASRNDLHSFGARPSWSHTLAPGSQRLAT
jgi:hypothetical protein